MKRTLLVVGAAAILVALLSPAAGAHAAYKYSDPDDKSTVSAPPSSVWAEFTEPPAPSSYLRIYDPCGRRVDNGDSQATGYRVSVTMNGSAAGTYRVDWAVLSTLDGHPTSGTFTFTASSGEECPGAPEEEEKEPRDQESARRDGGGDGEPVSASGSEAEAGADSEAKGAKKQSGRAGRERKAARAGDGSRDEGDGLSAAQSQNEQPPPPRPEMPMDGVVAGLALAVLIGAAGGYIYAGILGPRR